MVPSPARALAVVRPAYSSRSRMKCSSSALRRVRPRLWFLLSTSTSLATDRAVMTAVDPRRAAALVAPRDLKVRRVRRAFRAPLAMMVLKARRARKAPPEPTARTAALGRKVCPAPRGHRVSLASRVRRARVVLPEAKAYRARRARRAQTVQPVRREP